MSDRTQEIKNLRAVATACKSYTDKVAKDLQWQLGTYDLSVDSDTDTSYQKSVPSGAIDCKINSIGGMSYKSENLVVVADRVETTLSNFIYKIVNGEFYIKKTVDDSSQNNVILSLKEPITFKANVTYYLNFFNNNNYIGIRFLTANNTNVVSIDNSTNKAYTPTEDIVATKIQWFGSGNYNVELVYKPMVSLTTVTEFKQGFEGIRDSAATSVVSKDSNDTTLDTFTIDSNIQALVKAVSKLFIKFINEHLNPEIKKEYIRKKYDNKLYRLDKYSKDQWKLDYRDYEKMDSELRKDFKWSSKFSYKYYIKRTRLERMRDDSFIDENYEVISCDYPRVNPYAFTWYLSIKASDRLKYKVENKTIHDVALKVANKFIFALLGGAIIGLLLVEPDANELAKQANGWIAIMIRYIVRVGMIIANILIGIFTARRLFRENNLLPISNRTRILVDYRNYASEHPEEFKEVIPLYKQEALEEAKKIEREAFDKKVLEIKDELAKRNLTIQ